MLTCDICGKEFSRKYSFNVHVMTHLKKKTVKCSIPSCVKLFHTVASRNSHLLTHPEYAKHVSKKIKCPSCPKTFSKRSQLTSHLAVHSSARDFQCPDCGKTFKRRSNLYFHVQIHSGEGRDFQCDVCSKSFRRRYELIVHGRTHTGEKNFYCETCGARFITNSVLRKHVLKHHSQNRPTFDCELCAKSYKLKKSLVDHMHKHNNDFQQTCPVLGCDKIFKTQRALTSHQSLHHSKSNEKNTCTICHKNCLTKSKLVEHMRHHTGKRPFACTEDGCHKTFSTKTGLQRHLFLHTGVKPYICLKCNKEFAFASHYNSHVRSHFTIEKYKCRLCLDHVNTKMSTAKIHILQVHLGIKWEPKIFKRANVKINEKINSAIEKILVNTNEDIEEMPSLLIEKGNTEVSQRIMSKQFSIPNIVQQEELNLESLPISFIGQDENSVDQKPVIEDEVNTIPQLHSIQFPNETDSVEMKAQSIDAQPTDQILNSYDGTVTGTFNPESSLSSFLQDPNLLQNLPTITNGQQIFIYDPTTKEQVLLTSTVCSDSGQETLEVHPVHYINEETLEEEGKLSAPDQLHQQQSEEQGNPLKDEENNNTNTEMSMESNTLTTVYIKKESQETCEGDTSVELVLTDKDGADRQSEDISIPVPSLQLGDNIQVFHIQHPTRGTIKFAKLSNAVKGTDETTKDKATETIVFLEDDENIISKNLSNYDVTKICIRNEMEFLKVMNSMKITYDYLHDVTHKFECSGCGGFFWDTTALNKHMKSHSDTDIKVNSDLPSPINKSKCHENSESVMNTCVQCNKQFLLHSELDIQSQCTEKTFHCSNCKASREARPTLQDHNQAQQVEVYECSICLKILKSKRSASTHMKNHEKEHEEFVCSYPDCNKKFKHKRNMNFHERLHADTRPYQCEQCDKSFIARFQLNAHMKKHWGGKSYVCSKPDCGAVLTTRTGLLRHMIIHSGEKKFICNVCNHAFAFVGHLNTHMLTHTGEKNFFCSNCGKGFTRSTVLKRHVEKKICYPQL